MIQVIYENKMLTLGVILVAFCAVNKYRQDHQQQEQTRNRKKRQEYKGIIETNDEGSDEPDNEVIPLELEVINRKKQGGAMQRGNPVDSYDQFRPSVS